MPGGVLGPGDPKASGSYIRDLVQGRMPARVLENSPFPWVHVRDVAEGIVRAAEKEGNAGERYFLVGENLTFGEINRMISEIAGIRLPRMRLPDGFTLAGALLLTALARLTGKPPMLGLSLDQIRTMHGVDVIALISYDQVQHTSEDMLSIAYWTIVGMYVVKGERNDTNTMMDTAVYHIPSRKLLFRAPGTSQIKGSATPVNLSEQLRKDSYDGFVKANSDMIANLHAELERFKEKVKAQPEAYKVVAEPGSRGSGFMDPLTAILILMTGGAALWFGRKKD